MDRDGDGTGRGTWGRDIWGGGFIVGLTGDLCEDREISGRGGNGGLVGGEGQGFREEGKASVWDRWVSVERLGRDSTYSFFALSFSCCM